MDGDTMKRPTLYGPRASLSGPFRLHRPSGLLVLTANDLPSLIVMAERFYARTWLGLMAAGWFYMGPGKP
jgi:hypothetical protein